MEHDIGVQADIAKAASTISRRNVITTAAKLGLGAAGFAGGIGTALAQNEGAGLPKKNYKFFFVCHVTLDQFFTPTRYGAQDACAAYGCSYQWTGSEKNVVSEMVSAMQTAIAEKADGIAVCLVDPKAFDAATDQAVAAGIPVIAFNADVPYDQFVREHIAGDLLPDRQLRQFAQQAPIAEREAREVLDSVPCVGPVTADVVISELGDVRRFRSAKQVARYAGLAPGQRTSSTKRHGLPISKEGSPLLRWAMVETAWRLVGRSRRWGLVYEKFKLRMSAKKAIVAVARRLLCVLVALLRSGQKYRLASEALAEA